MLGDFDEGKRSCRFKLERHNNRRRRKVQESGEDAATPAGENDKASGINGMCKMFLYSSELLLPLHSFIHHLVLGSIRLLSCSYICAFCRPSKPFYYLQNVAENMKGRS